MLSVSEIASPSPTVVDYYRCPPEFAAFGVSDGVSADEGYFRFAGAVCYGGRQGPGAARVTDDLPDVSCQVAFDGVQTLLPFDLNTIVTNLRTERYSRTPHAFERATAARMIQYGYYQLRPLLPVAVRKHFQRVSLAGWKNIAFPAWPVDFTVDTLMSRMMALSLRHHGVDRIPFVWFWPDGAPSCAIVTHDVEHEVGRDFCERLMDIDSSRQIPAAFEVVPEGRYTGSHELCRAIQRRGFEVNVHDLNHDSHLFREREEFLRRAVMINQYGQQFKTRGFRAAAMYRRQEWFGALDFDYDMSVPNVAHLEPQRGGCCTAMPYFIGRILELPLTTIQDYSLFHILNDYSIDVWKAQIDLLLSRNALISVITHPDYLIERRAQSVYTALLDYLAALRDRGQIWVTFPADLNAWWRTRARMTVERHDGGWRVEGPDSARARVAFARFDGDRVVYEVDATC